MEYNITTIEKAKETLEEIEKKWKNIELEEIDYTTFNFVLEHITSNMNECKEIKLYGLKSIKTMLNEENNSFIMYCKKNTILNSEELNELIERYKKYNNSLCAFFSYEESEEIYKNSLRKYPKIFDKFKIRIKEWIEKAKPYRIIISVKYDDLKFYIDDPNSTINRMLAENIRKKINKESIEESNYVEIKRTIEPEKLKIEELK